MKQAIFLDRDGTINEDIGFVHKPEDLKFLPNAIDGLKKLAETGKFNFFIITNQSGIGLGHFEEKDFWNFMEAITSELIEHGIHIEDTYFAPDVPELPTIMRKPAIGMLKKAEQEHGIILSKSYIIGDRSTDVDMGWSAGCRTVLIKSERLKKYPPKIEPDVAVNDLLEAAEWIIKEEEREEKGKKKIYEREELKTIINNLKKEGKKIVTCNGSFDIMHYGHVYFLNEAKKQGNILVVMLNSDSSISEYKSKDRPINKQEYRAEVLAALEAVDYITIFDETTPIKTLEMIKPDIHANGSEYGKECVEAKTVKKHGGKLHLINRIGNFSTTEMIKKIKKAA